jgi:hypothetical protein
MCSSGVRIQYRPRAAFRLLLVLCKLSEAPSRRRHDAFGGEVSVAGARPTAVLPRFIVCHVAGVTPPPVADAAAGRQPTEITANILKRGWKAAGKRVSRSWRADFHRQNGRRRCGPVLATVRVRAAAGQVSIREVGMSGGLCHIVLRLVETDRTAPVQRCTDATLTGPSPPGGQPIDKTERAQPATSGCGPVGTAHSRAESSGEGLGGYDAQARRAL